MNNEQLTINNEQLTIKRLIRKMPMHALYKGDPADEVLLYK